MKKERLIIMLFTVLSAEQTHCSQKKQSPHHYQTVPTTDSVSSSTRLIRRQDPKNTHHGYSSVAQEEPSRAPRTSHNALDSLLSSPVKSHCTVQ